MSPLLSPRQELYLHWSLGSQSFALVDFEDDPTEGLIMLKMMMAEMTGKIKRKESMLALQSLPYVWGNYLA